MTAETPGTPLTPEEEEALRYRVDSGDWDHDEGYMRRVLATLDRERRERVDPDPETVDDLVEKAHRLVERDFDAALERRLADRADERGDEWEPGPESFLIKRDAEAQEARIVHEADLADLLRTATRRGLTDLLMDERWRDAADLIDEGVPDGS